MWYKENKARETDIYGGRVTTWSPRYSSTMLRWHHKTFSFSKISRTLPLQQGRRWTREQEGGGGSREGVESFHAVHPFGCHSMSIFQRYIPFITNDDTQIYLHVNLFLFLISIMHLLPTLTLCDIIRDWQQGRPLTAPPPLHSHGTDPFKNYIFTRLTKSTVKIVLEEIYLNYKWDY